MKCEIEIIYKLRENALFGWDIYKEYWLKRELLGVEFISFVPREQGVESARRKVEKYNAHAYTISILDLGADIFSPSSKCELYAICPCSLCFECELPCARHACGAIEWHCRICGRIYFNPVGCTSYGHHTPSKCNCKEGGN